MVYLGYTLWIHLNSIKIMCAICEDTDYCIENNVLFRPYYINKCKDKYLYFTESDIAVQYAPQTSDQLMLCSALFSPWNCVRRSMTTTQ